MVCCYVMLCSGVVLRVMPWCDFVWCVVCCGVLRLVWAGSCVVLWCVWSVWCCGVVCCGVSGLCGVVVWCHAVYLTWAGSQEAGLVLCGVGAGRPTGPLLAGAGPNHLAPPTGGGARAPGPPGTNHRAAMASAHQGAVLTHAEKTQAADFNSEAIADKRYHTLS